MSRRITQFQKNIAKELYDISSDLGDYSHNLLQTDVELDKDDIRQLEDKLFGAICLMRQVRHKITATPIHEKGQRA